MDAYIKTLLLTTIILSGCQTASTARSSTPTILSEPEVSVSTTIFPFSSQTVSMPRSHASLQGFIVKARELDKEGDMLRHMARQTNHLDPLASDPSLTDSPFVQSLTAKDNEYVVLVNGMSRIMVPLDLVTNTIVGRLHLGANSSIVIMPGVNINNGSLWSVQSPTSDIRVIVLAGEKVADEKKVEAGTLLMNFVKKADDDSPEVILVKDFAKTNLLANVAVIHRNSGGTMDQLVVPLGGKDGYRKILDVDTSLSGRLLLRDGDVVELTRFDSLPLVQSILLSLQ